MGGKASVGSFVAEDCFLRHVDRRRYLKRGIVKPEAFDDHHENLSFTFQNAGLQTEAGLDQYQRDKALPSEDLPGICKLSFYDLTESLSPPLPPRRDPNPDDERYGHLHCCTDRPIDWGHRVQMAKLASRYGVLREFVRRKKAARERL